VAPAATPGHENLFDGRAAAPASGVSKRSARLHHDFPATLRDERCSVQARILSVSASRPKLEAVDDVREDLAQLQQRERGAEASPLTAAEWKPRPRIRVAGKKPLGDERVWRRTRVLVDQRRWDQKERPSFEGDAP